MCISIYRYAACAGNFQDVAEQILSRISVEEGAPRMTFTLEKYLSHYLLSQGIIYFCITDSVSINTCNKIQMNINLRIILRSGKQPYIEIIMYYFPL